MAVLNSGSLNLPTHHLFLTILFNCMPESQLRDRDVGSLDLRATQGAYAAYHGYRQHGIIWHQRRLKECRCFRVLGL